VAKEEALPSIKGPQLVAPPHLTTFSKLLWLFATFACLACRFAQYI
jgi:hypothetical protein